MGEDVDCESWCTLRNVAGVLAQCGGGCLSICGSIAGFTDPFFRYMNYERHGYKPFAMNMDEFDDRKYKDWNVKSIHYRDFHNPDESLRFQAWLRNLSSPVLIDGANHHEAYATLVNPNNAEDTREINIEHRGGPLKFYGKYDPAENLKKYGDFTGSVEVPKEDRVNFGQFLTTLTGTYRNKGGWSPTYNCQVLSQTTMKEAANAPMTPYQDAHGVDYEAWTSETPWTIGFKWVMWAFALWSVYQLVLLVRWTYRQLTKTDTGG